MKFFDRDELQIPIIIFLVVTLVFLVFIDIEQESLEERITALESRLESPTLTTPATDRLYDLIIENSERTGKIIEILDSLTKSMKRLVEIER